MISAITAQGFKGLTFEQPLDRLTLFVGPNGAGKSARTQALALALQGYIPGAGKTNGDILQNFGTGEKLVVGFQIGKDIFERGFVSRGDSVAQGYKVNAKKAAKDVFMSLLGRAGNPVAIDLGVFLGLSDQKKIDFIFDLYPPESDINKIVAEIEKSKARVNDLTQKAKTAEEAAARLAASRATMQLPAGNLAELEAQEKALTDQLGKARQDLEDARIEAVKKDQLGKARQEMLSKIGCDYQGNDLGEMDIDTWSKIYNDAQAAWNTKERERIAKEEREKAAAIPAPAPSHETKTETSLDEVFARAPESQEGSLFDRAREAVAPAPQQQAVKPEEPAVSTLGSVFDPLRSVDAPAASIQAILDALNGAGCGACAAKLVAMRELKKYRRAAA